MGQKWEQWRLLSDKVAIHLQWLSAKHSFGLTTILPNLSIHMHAPFSHVFSMGRDIEVSGSGLFQSTKDRAHWFLLAHPHTCNVTSTLPIFLFRLGLAVSDGLHHGHQRRLTDLIIVNGVRRRPLMSVVPRISAQPIQFRFSVPVKWKLLTVVWTSHKIVRQFGQLCP